MYVGHGRASHASDSRRLRKLPKRLSLRSISGVSVRLDWPQTLKLYQSIRGTPTASDKELRDFRVLVAGETVVRGESDWETALIDVERFYAEYGANVGFRHRPWTDDGSVESLPLKAATRILETPRTFPRDLVTLSDMRLRQDLQLNLRSVARVAADNGWFNQEDESFDDIERS